MSSPQSSMGTTQSIDKEKHMEKDHQPFRNDFNSDDNCPYVLVPPFMTGVRRHYKVKQDDDYVYFRLDMPGFRYEDVMVSIEEKKTSTNRINFPGEEHTLIIYGEKENELGEKQSKEDQMVGNRRYYASFDMSPSIFKSYGRIYSVYKGVFRILVPAFERLENDVTNVVSDAKDDKEDEKTFSIPGYVRREWYAIEEEGKGFTIRIDMPGLSLNDVNVYLEGDNKTLVIEGMGKEESMYEEFGRRNIKCKINVTKLSKTEKFISMENGVFLLTIPPE